MKQLGDLIGVGIYARQVGTFMKIAIDTRERKIVEIVGATMLFGDDMLDVELSKRRIVLMQSTVFASIIGPLSHPVSCRSIHSLWLGFKHLSCLSP